MKAILTPLETEFSVGDTVRFQHTVKRRCSGEVYAVTPPKINPMGILIAAQLSVSVKFGNRLVNLGVDADYCRAEKILLTPRERVT